MLGAFSQLALSIPKGCLKPCWVLVPCCAGTAMCFASSGGGLLSLTKQGMLPVSSITAAWL